MDLLELFNKVIAKRQAHSADANKATIRQPDIKNSAFTINPRPGINTRLLDSHYPHMPPNEVLAEMIESVLQAPQDEQVNWWDRLAIWLEAGAEDLDWRCHIYESLSDQYDKQVQPIKRQDFELVNQIFANSNAGVIVDDCKSI